MEKNRILNLIEGDFTPEDAGDFLMNLIADKIRFHEVRSFSTRERLGVEDPVSRKRIPELRKTMEELKQLIEDARREESILQIRADIIINVHRKND